MQSIQAHRGNASRSIPRPLSVRPKTKKRITDDRVIRFFCIWERGVQASCLPILDQLRDQTELPFLHGRGAGIGICQHITAALGRVQKILDPLFQLFPGAILEEYRLNAADERHIFRQKGKGVGDVDVAGGRRSKLRNVQFIGLWWSQCNDCI